VTRASSDALVDVLVVGAGAAGMMTAIEAGRRGRRVRVVDHADRPGEKIRISGGGRCNFTNLGCGPANFLGENPRFATSALRRYTQHDFVKRIDRAGIAWHEKTLGQLFCDDSAKQIVRMLTDDMAAAGVTLSLKTGVTRIARSGDGFTAVLSDGSQVTAASLVVATGGKSIPKMGATGWAYDVARRFDLAGNSFFELFDGKLFFDLFTQRGFGFVRHFQVVFPLLLGFPGRSSHPVELCRHFLVRRNGAFLFGFLIQNLVLDQALQDLQTRLRQFERRKPRFLSLSLKLDDALDFFEFDDFTVDGRRGFVRVNAAFGFGRRAAVAAAQNKCGDCQKGNA